MRIKALLALLGLGLALMLVAGCSDDDDNNRTLSGVITNAGQTVTGQATATLFRNGAQVQTVAVGTNGRFTFTNVPEGTGYTVVVTSTATPAAFPTFTSNTFSVTGNTSTLNFDVAPDTAIVSGTVTDAATGQAVGAGEADVTIFQNGVQVATTQTTAGGGYSFSGITVGSGYIIVVTSTATPAAFPQFTSSAFAVSGNTTQNITVGTPITGETVTGEIGTTVANATFTVVAKNAAGATVDTTTTTLVGGIPTFVLLNVPIGTVTLEATSAQVPGVLTVLGPLDVPQGGVSALVFNVKTEAELPVEGVPVGANLAAFIPGGGTITVNSTTSTSGNPTYLTVPAGTYTVTVTPDGGTPVVVPNVTVSSGNVTVIRLPEFAPPAV